MNSSNLGEPKEYLREVAVKISFTRKHGFKLKKIERLIYVKNVNNTYSGDK